MTPCCVIASFAKVEWHPGELYPRVGFIVTNMARPDENVVAFYNKCGTCEQWIKEGKGAIKWTRLSCRSFAAKRGSASTSCAGLQSCNFLRTLATPEPIKDWSLTSLKDRLIKISAKIVNHGRYVAFQMAEVAIPKNLFADILRMIADLSKKSLRGHPTNDWPTCSCRPIQRLRELFGRRASSKN